MLAVLSATLTQRYARVDALYRLLRAWDELYYDPYDEHGRLRRYKQLQIEQIGGLLRGNDRLFLTDGWDDLLLILSDKPNESDEPNEPSNESREKRLLEIFAIQSAFFEDFMVDRTELMLAADCIPIALASPHFQLSYQYNCG